MQTITPLEMPATKWYFENYVTDFGQLLHDIEDAGFPEDYSAKDRQERMDLLSQGWLFVVTAARDGADIDTDRWTPTVRSLILLGWAILR